jgi:polyisoprenoid-binding protein YceI
LPFQSTKERNVMKSTSVLIGAVIAAASAATIAATAAEPVAIKIATAKVTITGTTNVHGYTASTSTVRVITAQAGPFDGDLMQLVQKPALLETFEIAIPAASLKSPKDGIDKNMHKALKADKFADITFRMKSLENRGTSVRALGTLTIAGVSKDIVLDLSTQRSGSNLSVIGEIPLLMTDYGITPPKAMLGMMKTDPKIVIRLELVLAPAVS